MTEKMAWRIMQQQHSHAGRAVQAGMAAGAGRMPRGSSLGWRP